MSSGTSATSCAIPKGVFDDVVLTIDAVPDDPRLDPALDALGGVRRRQGRSADAAAAVAAFALPLKLNIVVAIAATAFFTAKFNQAKDNVPDPVAL